MAEFYITVIDNVSDDPILDASRFKAGDVICMEGDGWQWSEDERTNPDRRILTMRGAAIGDYTKLTTSEALLTNAPIAPGVPTQVRLYSIDLTKAAPALADYLADDTRQVPCFEISDVWLQASIKVRATGDNPGVIG